MAGRKPRILLVSPDAQVDALWKPTPYLPNGLLFVAAVLEEDGCDVRLLDRNVPSAPPLDALLKSFAPDIAGVSVLTGKCILDAIEVSKRVKELAPSVPVAWGGVHPTLLPGQTLAEPYVDVVVRGDGEYAMRELAGALAPFAGTPAAKTEDASREAYAGVQGISYKDASGRVRHNASRPPLRDLNPLPDPAWHLLRMEEYPIISLNTSRGCPYRCAFCYNRSFNQGRRAEFGAARIVRQMRRLVEACGARHFKFYEDNFTMNRGRVEEFCDLLVESRLGVTWECEARAGSLDQGLLLGMRKAGCTAIGVGVESGSPRLLEFLCKGTTVAQIERMCEMCRRAKIGTYLYVMAGLPTETMGDFEMTLALLKRIPCYHHYELMIYRPYPGTELYDYCVREGLFTPPARLADWARWADLHSAENSLGMVPRGILARQLLKNQRDNMWSVVNFQLRTAPWALAAKLLSPLRLGRFIANLFRNTARLMSARGE